MHRKKRNGIPSLSKEERIARALTIYNNAPETVRTPAQQKAYDRWKAQQVVIQEKPKDRIDAKTRKKKKRKGAVSGQPRAHFVSGGIPSLGKR